MSSQNRTPLIPSPTVRVTGLREGRDGRWIEFEFSAGDPDLTVELVLGAGQFREFCSAHCIEIPAH